MQTYRILPAGSIVAPIEISDDEEGQAEPPAPNMDRKRKRIANRNAKLEPIYIDSDDDRQLVEIASQSHIRHAQIKRRKLDDSTLDDVSIVDSMEIDYYDDVDMTVQTWDVEPADRVPGVPRTQGERTIKRYSRRPRIYAPKMPFRPLAITDALSFLSLSSSQQPRSSLLPSHRVRLSLSSFTERLVNRYHVLRSEESYELRPNGAANAIVQSGRYLVIAANTGDADARNGLIVLESGTGQSIPLSFPGHARRKDGGLYLPGQNLNTEDIEYQSLLDVQFDPARPTVFSTSGMDRRCLIWKIMPSPDGSVFAKSVRSREASTEMVGQPHHIIFSPNTAHWGQDIQAISTHAVSDDRGKIHVHHFTRQKSVVNVQTRCNQLVSALCFGRYRSEDMLYGGTETKLWLSPARGNQLGFRLRPDGIGPPVVYTTSEDEVEHLCLSPQGDKLASLTANFDASSVECRKCDRRRIVSSHKLSIYSSTSQSGRPTPTHNPNLIGEVVLPPFPPSDRSDESGAVVTSAWSPCGIQIAVARDDDSVNIFDTRFLGSEPLLTLKHAGSYPVASRRAVNNLGMESQCCTVPNKQPEHGITGLQWIEGVGNSSGLVTAGGDGTVRLWDTRQTNQYIILSTLETGIASISLGDVSKGEPSLVVGDNDGLLKVFNSRGLHEEKMPTRA